MSTPNTVGPLDMPRSYYRNESLVDEEQRRIFGDSWLFVAHTSEMPSPGDYVTRQLGADPVIVSRSESGDVHVLLNSCTHRGTQVCKATFGNSATFQCGYHGWAFGNNGDLKGVPGGKALYGPDFDRSTLGLRKARVGVTQHGFVFATWAHDGPSLAEFLGDYAWYLDAIFGLFPGGMEVHGGAHRVRVRGNWKIHAENFAGDGYHLRVAHRTMFEMGVMGVQAAKSHGFVITDPNGHALRAQYVSDPNIEKTIFGHPEELLDGARSFAPDDQIAFRTSTSVIHGLVFPNLLLITTAPVQFGSDAEGQTAFYQLRTVTPVDAHTHDLTYWTLVPSDTPEEWKRRSYLYTVRQHGAGSFFEADDLENFRRIDAGLGHVAGEHAPFNYQLGVGAPEQEQPHWNGPCRIVGQDFSEVNQRNFLNRYLELMEAGQ
jgi:phenylpropionate dioxygenase-like ring-hydroxylating dioxygenase large terminal subunit